MTPEQITMIAIPVMALTQMIKRSRYVPERGGPVVVAAVSVLAVLLYALAPRAYAIFAGIVMVMISAAGVYSLSRPINDGDARSRQRENERAANPPELT